MGKKVKKLVEPSSTIKLVRRSEWGADLQDGDIPHMELPANNVFFTYSETDQCSSNSATLASCHNVVRKIQKHSMFERGLPDIPYNFLLGGDGCVYEGRGWRLKPEPIPEEPELNERNTLVVAYIGRKDDEIGWPGYFDETIQILEDSFLLFGLKKKHIHQQANLHYLLDPQFKTPIQEYREDWEAELQIINEDWCKDHGIPVNSSYDWKKWRKVDRFTWG